VVIDNEILVHEYVTKWNMAPPGVRKLNKQALEQVVRVLYIKKLDNDRLGSELQLRM